MITYRTQPTDSAYVYVATIGKRLQAELTYLHTASLGNARIAKQDDLHRAYASAVTLFYVLWDDFGAIDAPEANRLRNEIDRAYTEATARISHKRKGTNDTPAWMQGHPVELD